MDDHEKMEWSRHYDSIQWTVTTILIGATGGLFAFVYSPDSFHTPLALLGAFLTVASVFFAASFRALRARLHAELPDADEKYLRSTRMFRQWPVYVIVHLVLFLSWVFLLIQRRPEHKPTWALTALLGLIAIVAYGFASDGPLRKKGRKARDA